MIDNKYKNERRLTAGIIISIAIVCFANPTVRLFDIFPDFIACFIIARALRFPSDRAPFFSEARAAFLKLAIISIAKIPGFIALVSIRGSNVSDYDICVLMTFSFALIEAVYFYSAINNLFAGFFYLGERSSTGVLLRPFKTSANEYSDRLMKPETLRIITFVFTAFKLLAGALPEMLLLSTTSDFGTGIGYGSGYLFYPYIMVLGIILTIAFGVFFAKSFLSYIKAIRSEGSFYPALDSLVKDEARVELDIKIRKRTIRWGFDLLIIATLFIFSVRFDNLQEVNLIPYAAFAPIAVIGLFKLTGKSKIILPTLISGTFFTFSAIVYQIFEFKFLEKYGFDLLFTDKTAKAEFLSTICAFALSTVCFIALLVCISIALCSFSKKTIIKPNDHYSDKIRLDRYSTIKLKTALWCVIGSITAISKLADSIFKYFPNVHNVVSGGGGYTQVTSALVPWFGTFVFIISIVFLAFTAFIASSYKDDADVYLK